MEVLNLLDAGPQDYTDVWQLQRQIHDAVQRDTRPDTVILVEHASVYTAGRRTAQAERPAPGGPIPVIDVDRGGRLTWHGPGQLVGYPIVRLAQPVDPVAYVRALEQALLAVCAAYGVAATTEQGRTGVWIAPHSSPSDPHRKIASIGARIAAGVTMHGFALNISNSLAPFSTIVACGLPDAAATTLNLESGLDLAPQVVAPVVAAALNALLPPLLAAQAPRPVTSAAPNPATTPPQEHSQPQGRRREPAASAKETIA